MDYTAAYGKGHSEGEESSGERVITGCCQIQRREGVRGTSANKVKWVGVGDALNTKQILSAQGNRVSNSINNQ